MYNYKGYVVLVDTGVAMPFVFNSDYYSMSEDELISYIGNKLNEPIRNIKWIEEYKVTKK